MLLWMSGSSGKMVVEEMQQQLGHVIVDGW